jgi:site-specific DNA-methyltransferase (adenine-specific)/modification methylase
MKKILEKRLKEKMLHNESCFDTFKRMGDKSVDFVFTSPPYNRKRNDKYKYFNDTETNYFSFLDSVISESLRISKEYVFLNIMKNYYNSEAIYKLFGKWSEQIAEVFVWEKLNPLPASGFSITNSFEYIIAFGKKGLKSNKTYTKNHLSTSTTKMPSCHKAVMNEKVAFFFIENFTKEGHIIYDPFMGTGTTAVVCEKLNRKWIGSEISKEYFLYSLEKISTVK